MVVTADYSKKDLVRRGIAKYGLGFARVHRSVFGTLKEKSVTSDGQSLVPSARFQSIMFDDYFPRGVQGMGDWLGEDNGFFTLCGMAGIPVRRETRTRLVHWGRVGFGYEPELAAANSELPSAPQ